MEDFKQYTERLYLSLETKKATQWAYKYLNVFHACLTTIWVNDLRRDQMTV